MSRYRRNRRNYRSSSIASVLGIVVLILVPLLFLSTASFINSYSTDEIVFQTNSEEDFTEASHLRSGSNLLVDGIEVGLSNSVGMESYYNKNQTGQEYNTFIFDSAGNSTNVAVFHFNYTIEEAIEDSVQRYEFDIEIPRNITFDYEIALPNADEETNIDIKSGEFHHNGENVTTLEVEIEQALLLQADSSKTEETNIGLLLIAQSDSDEQINSGDVINFDHRMYTEGRLNMFYTANIASFITGTILLVCGVISLPGVSLKGVDY